MIDLYETVVETDKVKKLKLKPFQTVFAAHVEVVLRKFTMPDDVVGYGAVAIVWLSAKEGKSTPVEMFLPLAGPCAIKVAFDAMGVAVGMSESVRGMVSVFDGDDEIFVLTTDELLEAHG